MRIAVLLSGTVRFRHKSLASVNMLRGSGNRVDVYLHAWKDVARTATEDSWSKYPVEEPTDEVIATYSPVRHMVESWEIRRRDLAKRVEVWQKEGILKNFTHLGMLGMWYSVQQAFDLADDAENYDLVVRLRFDCELRGGMLPVVPGWSVPEAVDFGGTCDQLAWYARVGKEVDHWNLCSYFTTYTRIRDMLASGTPFSPECLLATSFKKYGVTPSRPRYDFSIHGD